MRCRRSPTVCAIASRDLKELVEREGRRGRSAHPGRPRRHRASPDRAAPAGRRSPACALLRGGEPQQFERTIPQRPRGGRAPSRPRARPGGRALRARGRGRALGSRQPRGRGRRETRRGAARPAAGSNLERQRDDALTTIGGRVARVRAVGLRERLKRDLRRSRVRARGARDAAPRPCPTLGRGAKIPPGFLTAANFSRQGSSRRRRRGEKQEPNHGTDDSNTPSRSAKREAGALGASMCSSRRGIRCRWPRSSRTPKPTCITPSSSCSPAVRSPDRGRDPALSRPSTV